MPKDGQLVRLWLRDGTEITGYYSGKWWGWVDYNDPWPLIRGDIAFRGWEPVDQVEPLVHRERGLPGAPVVVEPASLSVVEPEPSDIVAPAQKALVSRIVVARKPSRGR